MTRKPDSGWRDSALNQWHVDKGFPCPAAGMSLPMIEYNRGKAVGLVNYIWRGNPLPTGPDVAAAYRAFGRVHDDSSSFPLPFLTVVYDPRNWAVKLYPHNDVAAELVTSETGINEYPAAVSEVRFATLLYRMRGRPMPDMFGYGVEWSQSDWLNLEQLGVWPVPAFPGADMSARRREYEPNVSAPMRVKLPCLDIDLAVVDRDDHLAMVVDYKRVGALCDVKGTNATALASLTGPSGLNVPAFMTRYFGTRNTGYHFETYALNKTAWAHLSYVLGAVDVPAPVLAQAVTGGWVRLTERHWLDVLKVARDL